MPARVVDRRILGFVEAMMAVPDVDLRRLHFTRVSQDIMAASAKRTSQPHCGRHLFIYIQIDFGHFSAAAVNYDRL